MLALSIVLGVLCLLALVTGLLTFWQGRGSVPGGNEASITVDNELRFYSAYWIGYGLLCGWVAANLPEHLSIVPLLAAVLFLSGLGRLLSLVRIGKPAPLYVPFMIAEFVVPLVMISLFMISGN
jgi:hypothetical protein